VLVVGTGLDSQRELMTPPGWKQSYSPANYPVTMLEIILLLRPTA
jgi:hypothetical protein